MIPEVKSLRPFECEAFTLVKVQSETQSIGSEVFHKGKNERRGQRILSEICMLASDGLRSQVEFEEKKFRWKGRKKCEGGKTV